MVPYYHQLLHPHWQKNVKFILKGHQRQFNVQKQNICHRKSEHPVHKSRWLSFYLIKVADLIWLGILKDVHLKVLCDSKQQQQWQSKRNQCDLCTHAMSACIELHVLFTPSEGFGLVHGETLESLTRDTVVVTVFGEADMFHALTDSRIHGWLSLGRTGRETALWHLSWQEVTWQSHVSTSEMR